MEHDVFKNCSSKDTNANQEKDIGKEEIFNDTLKSIIREKLLNAESTTELSSVIKYIGDTLFKEVLEQKRNEIDIWSTFSEYVNLYLNEGILIQNSLWDFIVSKVVDAINSGDVSFKFNADLNILTPNENEILISSDSLDIPKLISLHPLMANCEDKLKEMFP